MPKETISIEIKASCEAVFDLVHDYERRLTWDSMLKEAKILGKATRAGIGVHTRCVGTWKTLGIPMDTEYIRFERGKVAAVKLVNRAPFFQNFAATIRHERIDDTDDSVSRITYIYSFRSRPEYLSFMFEPIMNRILRSQVTARLDSLRSFMESKSNTQEDLA